MPPNTPTECIGRVWVEKPPKRPPFLWEVFDKQKAKLMPYTSKDDQINRIVYVHEVGSSEGRAFVWLMGKQPVQIECTADTPFPEENVAQEVAFQTLESRPGLSDVVIGMLIQTYEERNFVQILRWAGVDR